MPRFEITRARAFSRDVLYASGMPEEAESQESFTRIYQFYEGSWDQADVQISTQRILRFQRPEGGKIAVYMSHDGVLFSPEKSFRGGPIVDEKLDATKRLGRLSDIREIGHILVACGEGGQTYRQMDSGVWTPLDPNLFDNKIDSNWVFAIKAEGNTGAEEEAYWKIHPEKKIELDRRVNLLLKQTDLHSIDGLSINKIYMSGSKGAIYFWDGHKTERLSSPTSSYLTDILVEDDETVWICGRDGTLLRGNAKQGFALIPCEGAPNFSKMTTFQGKLYLSSYANPRGAFCYDGQSIRQVDGGEHVALDDVHTVDGVTDALWAVGSRKIARFDGKSWEPIAFPT